VAGSPLHVAVHLRALGWQSLLLTRVGNDPDGRRVLALLAERDVDASLVQVDPRLPTGQVTVELRGTDPYFTIHGPAAWDRLTGPPRLPAHDVFCYGTLVGRSPQSLDTMRTLLSQSRALCALDVNLRPRNKVDDALRVGLERARMVKMNGEELAGAAAILHIRPKPSAFFALAPELRWICVTRGADGAELHDSSGRAWSVPGEDVEVADTVGAGDAFFAGLIDGLAKGRDEDDSLIAAQARAVAVVTRRGGLPPV
jgi:fructokinase